MGRSTTHRHPFLLACHKGGSSRFLLPKPNDSIDWIFGAPEGPPHVLGLKKHGHTLSPKRSDDTRAFNAPMEHLREGPPRLQVEELHEREQCAGEDVVVALGGGHGQVLLGGSENGIDYVFALVCATVPREIRGLFDV